MRLYDVFLSIHAKDFAAQTDWWARFLGRQWDRAPMPSCHEWSLTGDILFQVLDSSNGYGGATVTLHVADLDAEIARLGAAGIAVPAPVKVDGFDTLRFSEFTDPEGNTVSLLDGR